ncbi:hypothetical protein [Mycolicibacterium neworleansense]|uniref:hypothetical protein n=1 Tax=Mycolicibacterium neworleansense TaxID=146018 RepID=UPI00103D5638|nr:hypothetical protein [Mycolicibacterium neworleansense]MCV7364038.1 hypothetical protein [Mycolicibacterium neworleansense]
MSFFLQRADQLGEYLNRSGVWEGTGAQDNWRWCRHCYTMFFGGFDKQGSCPTGGAHDKSESYGYALEY